jgi:sulfonate transport system substrate-binding protein
VPEHFNLPWRLAIADDSFAGTGTDVEFVDYPGGTGAMNAALRDEDLDAALILTEGAVLDILGGGKNRLVSTYVDSSLVWGIYVAASGGIHDVAGIEGTRFAISRFGSGSHLIAAVDAGERGFLTQDMKFVVVENIDGARAALAAGTADVFLWEKHMTQPLVDAGEFRRVGERVVPWPAFVVSVRQEYLADHKEAILKVLDVVAVYASQLKTGVDSANLISTSYGIALADAESWLSGVQWSHDRRCPAAAIQRVVTALHSQGILESPDADLESIWQQL